MRHICMCYQCNIDIYFVRNNFSPQRHVFGKSQVILFISNAKFKVEMLILLENTGSLLIFNFFNSLQKKSALLL